ncbi:MAG: MarR family transcriptional regulator [Acidimicrobiia bacterium]|jgi:DNA-binding MarR family transcriptional regulator
MLQRKNREVAELLLKLAEFGQLVTASLAEVARHESLVSNTHLVVLCRLELYGPQRPSDIMDVTGLTSGGVTKLIDRLVSAGWVERLDEPVPDDGRGVMVGLTPAGQESLQSMVDVLAGRLGETREVVREINRLLPD